MPMLTTMTDTANMSQTMTDHGRLPYWKRSYVRMNTYINFVSSVRTIICDYLNNYTNVLIDIV